MKKHNLSKTKLYKMWHSMISRCKKSTLSNHKYYYDKGIKVCKEWENDFIKFYDWSINNGYKEGLSIDRIDYNGNYCPQNCRFVTMKQQGRNKSFNVKLTKDGETHCISEWTEILGVKKSLIYNRLKRGWTVEEALSSKLRRKIK